jgi:thiosulfate/3-mercaptopyruvate sulfurtransferase
MFRRLSQRYLLNLGLLTISTTLLVSACSDDAKDGPDAVAGAAGSPDSDGSPGASGSSGASGTGASPGAGAEGGSSGSAGSDGSGGNAAGQGGVATSDGGAPVSGGEAGDGGTAAHAGNGGEGGEDGALAVLPRSSPRELTDESAADYADNVHGVITGSTLKPWVENWTANRPPGVAGKLVVLQIGSTSTSSVVHVQEGSNVASYLVPTSELVQVRDNGLSSIEAEIPNGVAADAFLKKYGVDALKDYVVLTFEQVPGGEQAAATTNAIVQSVGRAWLLLRYWGFPKERLAILNGSVNWNAQNQGLPVSNSAAPTPPNDGESSVRDLRVDNTGLVVTLSELLGILKDESDEYPRDQVSVVDARGGAEALGLLKSTSTGKQDCASWTGTTPNARCSPPFEGRIKGAHSVPWPEFLTAAQDGFRFPAKDVVQTKFDELSDYEEGNVTIQYCRTNMRSMVTGIVAAVILGYPTRFYDTSFIEWSHLAYGPTPRTQVLPPTSPYRTDLPELTEHATVTGYTPGGAFDAGTVVVTGWVNGPNYNADADISPTPIQVVPTAASTNRSVEEDRAYKL